MSKITPFTIDKINNDATIIETIEDFSEIKPSGSSFKSKCFNCSKDGKLSIAKTKNIASCFSCDIKGLTPINYLIKMHGKTYYEALKYLASKFNIVIEYEAETKNKPTKKPKQKPTTNSDSFLKKQLIESGLEQNDLIDYISTDADTKTEIKLYMSGSVNEKFEYIPSGDDVVFRYLTLNNTPATYYRKNKTGEAYGKPLPLYRVRWKHPEDHTDRYGRAMKYQSPPNSGMHLWFPKPVRNAYKEARQFETLYIQEGEKKADKATKHGLFSVGTMGIHNIARNKKLPTEIKLLIERCGIKNVVFVLDSDLFELGNLDAPVDMRPRNFFTAVKNFKTYFYTLNNKGIHLELYFAHIKKNKANEKGIDDLLAGRLQNKERDLKQDFAQANQQKDYEGDYITSHKITTLTDYNLLEFWNLQDAETFAFHYKNKLQDLNEFKIGRHKWRFIDGEFQSAQPLQDNEQYFKIQKDKDGNTSKINIDYVNLYNFLNNREFGRYITHDGTKKFIQIENNVIKEVEPYDVRDFVISFTKEFKQDKHEILNFLYRSAKTFFSIDSISNINFIKPELLQASKTTQQLFFNNVYWEITADKITENNMEQIQEQVWANKIIPQHAYKTAPLIEVFKITKDHINANRETLKNNNQLEAFETTLLGNYDINITEIGEKCDFLSFLHNTSNFIWRNPEKATIEDRCNLNKHLLSKLTAIGYMLHAHFNPADRKAIICMDGKVTEVGKSNGRTGKSLTGEFVSRIVPTHYIPAKAKNIEQDLFLFDGIEETHQVVFLDDCRSNIDFEFFFPHVTGKFVVNEKGNRKYTIPQHLTPKLLFTTNHAINGEGSSFTDRQFFCAFSDYYNEERSPKDDFGILFEDWSAEQWNLAYNLAATCIQLYLKHGLIEAPQEDLERRRLRQQMTENFVEWAETYFDDDQNIDVRIPKLEMYENGSLQYGKSFLETFPNQKKWVDIRIFKKRIKMFCYYKGWVFNPKRPNPETNLPYGGNDKSHNVEYFTITKSMTY